MPRINLTDARREFIVRMAFEGQTDKAIYDEIGISKATFYRWLKRDDTLATDYARAREGGEVNLALKVIKAADADWRAAAWYLSRRYHWVETPPDSSGDDPAWDIWDADTEPSDGSDDD